MSSNLHWGRTRTVARREFLATVRRPGYLLTLILMPLFMAVIGVLPAVGLALSGGPQALLGLPDPDEAAVLLIVDDSGANLAPEELLSWHNDDQALAAKEGRRFAGGDTSGVPALAREWLPDMARDRGGFSPEARFQLQRAVDEGAARTQVEGGQAIAAWVAGPNYLETAAMRVLVARKGGLDPGLAPGRLAIARLLRRALVGDLISDAAIVARLVHVVEPSVEVLGKKDTSLAQDQVGNAATLMLPLIFSSFFGMSIFVASGYLLDGIGEEKENRVLEVLLATLRPEELLLGKMIGLGAAGLLQTLFFALLGGVPLVALGLFEVGPARLLAMTVSALLGYSLYASLMGASGAVAGNRHEGRQVSAVWSLLAISPMLVLPAFLARPNDGLALLATFIPLTAPIALILRLGLGEVPILEVVGSWIVVALAALVAWRLGARVFRVAILMTGTRPSLRQVLGWLRAPSVR